WSPEEHRTGKTFPGFFCSAALPAGSLPLSALRGSPGCVYAHPGSYKGPPVRQTTGWHRSGISFLTQYLRKRMPRASRFPERVFLRNRLPAGRTIRPYPVVKKPSPDRAVQREAEVLERESFLRIIYLSSYTYKFYIIFGS